MQAWKRTVLALAILPTGVMAGAPMATEDADVLAQGQCEWESTHERIRLADHSARAWETGVGCHAFKGTQAGLRVSHAKAEGVAVRGMALGGKTALVARDGDGFGLTLAWGLEWLKRPGSRLKLDTHALSLVASQGLGGGLTVHANLGWSRSRLADESVRGWALGAEYALSERFDLLAETYGEQRSKPSHGLGLRFNASEAWSFGLMAARSRDEPSTRSLLLSAKLAL